MTKPNICLVKPPDRFLDSEFVYPQLAPNYLHSFLKKEGFDSDLVILHEDPAIHNARGNGGTTPHSLEDLRVTGIVNGELIDDVKFNSSLFANYDIVAMSVMSPQAADAVLLSSEIKRISPDTIVVAGGPHAKHYMSDLKDLPEHAAFDYIVPYDGWHPILDIVSGRAKSEGKNTVLSHTLTSLDGIPPPSRPMKLMQKYNFGLGGIPASHTVTALGCPFSCYFCESGREKLRKFPLSTIKEDLDQIAKAYKDAGIDRYGLMIFDDVGLMSPPQVQELSKLIKNAGFTGWRAFTHAYLVVQFKEQLLGPFKETGGIRIGLGLESGSQNSLDRIHKRNQLSQLATDNYEAVRIANKLGIAVDAFTMIFPWEDEKDLKDTTELIKFIAHNKVEGVDFLGRPLQNYVDSSIMIPFKGTEFFDIFSKGGMPEVELRPQGNSRGLFYKGVHGSSGWPYSKTTLSKERYEEEQKIRHATRPAFR